MVKKEQPPKTKDTRQQKLEKAIYAAGERNRQRETQNREAQENLDEAMASLKSFEGEKLEAELKAGEEKIKNIEKDLEKAKKRKKWNDRIEKAKKIIFEEAPTPESGVEEVYDAEGKLVSRKLSNGITESYRDGKIFSKTYISGVTELFTKGILSVKILPDGTWEKFDENGNFVGHFDSNESPALTPDDEEKTSKKKDKKNKKEVVKPKTPEEEVKDFITGLNLQELLPPEFENLSDAQKLKVIRDLKRRIVDIVKSDAQTQYSESLKGQSIFKGIKKLATKEWDLKKLETEVFTEMKDTEEGRKYLQRDLAILTEATRIKDVDFSKLGNPFVVYANPYRDLQHPSEKEVETYENFNNAAFKFSKMPYEWGQEPKGKHRKEYDKVKEEYDNARNEVLKITTETEEQRGVPANERTAMLRILEVDNTLQMEQLLNTHPEVEQLLNDFSRSAGGEEARKSLGNFIQAITGGKGTSVRTITNKLLFFGGIGARVGVKAVSAASSMTVLGAIGTAAVGGIIGGIRGRFRAMDTLSEKEIQARHGQKDTSKEKAKMVDIVPLINGLQKMAFQAETATDDKEKSKILAKLLVLIEYAHNQTEAGQVNFGDAKSALVNQFNFVNNLNRALVVTNMNVGSVNVELREKINHYIEIQGKEVDEKISDVQKKFITKQMWRGAALGVGAATVGYTLRLLGEQMHLFGHASVGAGGKTGPGHSIAENNHNGVGSVKGTNPDTHGGVSTKPAEQGGLQHKPENIAPKIPIQPETTPTPAGNFGGVSITFDHGKGGIQGILDLKAQIRDHYPDISKAPKSVQDFMNTDAKTQAIKLKLWAPGDTNESALLKAGSILKMDEHGNILFGKPDHLGSIDEHGWKMFHSGNHDDVLQTTPESATPGNTPINADNYTPGQPLNIHTQQIDNSILEHSQATETPAQDIEEIRQKLIAATEAHAQQQAENAADHTATIDAQGGRLSYPLKEGGESHLVEKTGDGQSITENSSGLSKEFASNHYNLSPEKLLQAYTIGKEDTDSLFGQQQWETLKNIKVGTILQHSDTEKNTTILRYLNILENTSKIKPKLGLSIFGSKVGGETMDKYMARVLQYLSSTGKLADFQEKVALLKK